MNYFKKFSFIALASLFVFGAACKKSNETQAIVTPGSDTSTIASVSTDSVNSISVSGGNVFAGIVQSGGASVTERGVCWSKTINPTIADAKAMATAVSGSGKFTTAVSNLSEYTIYHVRAYATNRAGIAYGNDISFTTNAVHPPTLTTMVTNFIGATIAASGATITGDGGAPVTAKGVCWGAAHLPTISNSKTSDGTGLGQFTSNLTGLTKSTVYYIRAYATNSSGTFYGNELSFTTAASGNVTYAIVKVASPTAEQQNAYNLMTAAMDSAVWYYNNYTTITKSITVYYEPSVATADGNSNGTIRFGSVTGYMEKTRAMHEIAHTVGVGTVSAWTNILMIGGIYKGANALAMYRSIYGVAATAVLNGDTQHFWPYGLNYLSEYQSTADLINHCRIVNAMKQDGL